MEIVEQKSGVSCGRNCLEGCRNSLSIGRVVVVVAKRAIKILANRLEVEAQPESRLIKLHSAQRSQAAVCCFLR